MNVIFFITDQQRADHMGCAGKSVLQTPNIDKLASEVAASHDILVACPAIMDPVVCENSADEKDERLQRLEVQARSQP